MEKTILIVDDDKAIVTVLTLILEEEKYRVHNAFTGQEGYDLATRERPDLILMDYMLPDSNGDEVAAEIRKQLKDQSMPIILISAAHNAQAIVKAAGLDGYIAKPFAMETLLATVKKFLSS